MKWILLMWFLFFLMSCQLSTGQSTDLSDKAWIGVGRNSIQNTEIQNGFVVYYFGKNGAFETNDTTVNYTWKYMSIFNKVRIKNFDNSEVFTYKVVKCTKDSLIMRNKENDYHFVYLNLPIISLSRDSLYSLLTNTSFINSSDTTKKIIFNGDKSIYFSGANINVDILNEMKWYLEFFRGAYFLLITPEVISYQIILLEDKLLLKSINAKNSPDLYMNIHKE